MKAEVIGHICIDKNVSEHASYTGPGGPAFFISCVYKHFPGVDTSIISPYGSDILQYLNGVGILPERPSRLKTHIYENNSLGNFRTQKAHNTQFAYPPHITDTMIAELSSTDILFFAPLTPHYEAEHMREFLRHKKPGAISILLPQGYYRDFAADGTVMQRAFTEAEHIVPQFDFVVVSREDHADMHAIAREWAGAATVIMTLGDEGAAVLNNDTQIVVPTLPVRVEDIVDSVGSGDIFSASFAYQYFHTGNVIDSVRFGNEIARQCLFYPSNDLRINIQP